MMKTWAAFTLVVGIFFSSWAQIPIIEQIVFKKYEHRVLNLLTKPHYSIQMEDGSIWKFSTQSFLSEKSKAQLARWKVDDRVEFSIKPGIFNVSCYLVNVETGEKIDTELLEEACDEMAHHIVDFNLDTKIITLSDGSKWEANKITCLGCLGSIKKKFKNKIFVAKEYGQQKFYLITRPETSSSTEHLEVLPAGFCKTGYNGGS